MLHGVKECFKYQCRKSKTFFIGIGTSEGASRFSKLFIDEKVLHYEKREIWEAADAIVHKDPK